MEQLEPSKVTSSLCQNFTGWHIFINDSVDVNKKDYNESLANLTTAYTLKKEIRTFSDFCAFNYPGGKGIVVAQSASVICCGKGQ